jgi:DNA polymerase-1
MPAPAFTGTHPHPGIPGATMTAGGAHFVDWLQQHLSTARALAVDIETYGVDLDGYRIKCVILATEHAAFVADPRDLAQAVLIRQALDYALELDFHNAPFDVPSLVINGLMSPQAVNKSVDTLVIARCATPGETVPKTLDACAARYLGLRSENKITDMFKALGLTKSQGYERLDINSPAYLMGAAADGVVTARLRVPIWDAAIRQLTEGHPFRDGLSRYEAGQELEKHQVVSRWGLRQTIKGLAVNLDYLEQFRALNGQARASAARALTEAGITPGNGNHLTTVLHGLGVLPEDHPRTATGKLQADQKALATLTHPLATTFSWVKKLDKIDAYLEKCRSMSLMDGRIHPTTQILAAAHGRSSMRGVEIHQFPALARPIVLFDEDGTSVDWAAQEPMLMLNMAGDTMALEGYELRGEKLYTAIAEYGRIPYKTAKVVLLAGMYGEGLRKLSADLGLDFGPYFTRNGRSVPSYQAGKEMQDKAFAAIPRSREMLATLKTVAKQNGKVITINGRVLPIPMGRGWVDEDGNEGPPGRQTHKGPNYRICGSAADMMMDTVAECERRGIGDGLWFNMHDEFACATSISHEVEQIMQTPSERLCRAAGRRPIIRTDLERLGAHWKGEEK